MPSKVPSGAVPDLEIFKATFQKQTLWVFFFVGFFFVIMGRLGDKGALCWWSLILREEHVTSPHYTFVSG